MLLSPVCIQPIVTGLILLASGIPVFPSSTWLPLPSLVRVVGWERGILWAERNESGLVGQCCIVLPVSRNCNWEWANWPTLDYSILHPFWRIFIKVSFCGTGLLELLLLGHSWFAFREQRIQPRGQRLRAAVVPSGLIRRAELLSRSRAWFGSLGVRLLWARMQSRKNAPIAVLEPPGYQWIWKGFVCAAWWSQVPLSRLWHGTSLTKLQK